MQLLTRFSFSFTNSASFPQMRHDEKIGACWETQGLICMIWLHVLSTPRWRGRGLAMFLVKHCDLGFFDWQVG